MVQVGLGDEGAQQPVLEGLTQEDVRPSRGTQDLSIEVPKGAHPHAQGAAGLGQAALPGPGLQPGGNEHAGLATQLARDLPGALDQVGGLAASGGRQVEMDGHRETSDQPRPATAWGACGRSCQWISG